MEASRWDKIKDVICSFQSVTISIYMINLVFLVLILLLFFFAEPEGDAYTILLIDLAIVLPATVLLFLVLYMCRD